MDRSNCKFKNKRKQTVEHNWIPQVNFYDKQFLGLKQNDYVTYSITSDTKKIPMSWKLELADFWLSISTFHVSVSLKISDETK